MKKNIVYDNQLSFLTNIPYELQHVKPETEAKKPVAVGNKEIAVKNKEYGNCLQFEIKKYLGENEKLQKALVEALKNQGNKSLLVSPMGSGKTFIILNTILNYCKENNIILVMAIPNVAQILSLINDGELDAWGVFATAEQKEWLGESLILTTPESLQRAIKAIRAKEAKYLLVVDEAHEIITTNYRDFRNILDVEKSAVSTLYVTATPHALELEQFDNKFEVQASKTLETSIEILDANKYSADYALQVILNASKKYDKVVYFSDRGRYLNDLLGDTLVEDYKKTVAVIDSENKDSDEYEALLNATLPDAQITLHTSVMKAGINIYNDDNTCVIMDLYNCNSTSDIIQLIGRYRNNLTKVKLMTFSDGERDYINIDKNYSQIYEEQSAGVDRIVETINIAPDLEINKSIGSYYMISREEISPKKFEYRTNTIEVKKYAYATANKYILQDVNKLATELSTSKAFAVKEIDIVDMTKTKIGKELAEKAKKIKEDLANQEIEKFKEALEVLTNNFSNDTIDTLFVDKSLSRNLDKSKQEVKEALEVFEKMRSKRKEELDRIRLMYKLYFKDKTKAEELKIKNEKGEFIVSSNYESYQTSIDYVLSNSTKHITKKIMNAEVRNLNYKLITRGEEKYMEYLNNTYLRQRQDVRQIKIYHEVQKMRCVGASKRMSNKQVDMLVQILIDGKYLNFAGKKLSTLKNQVIRELKAMYYMQEDKQRKEAKSGQTKAHSNGYYLKAHKWTDYTNELRGKLNDDEF